MICYTNCIMLYYDLLCLAIPSYNSILRIALRCEGVGELLCLICTSLSLSIYIYIYVMHVHIYIYIYI